MDSRTPSKVHSSLKQSQNPAQYRPSDDVNWILLFEPLISGLISLKRRHLIFQDVAQVCGHAILIEPAKLVADEVVCRRDNIIGMISTNLLFRH